MENIVLSDADGILHIHFPETLNDAVVTQFENEYTAQICRNNTKKRVIVYLDRIENIPPLEITGKVSQIIKDKRPYIATSCVSCGGDTSKRIAVRVMLTLAGRSDIKVFLTKEEALAYIQQA